VVDVITTIQSIDNRLTLVIASGCVTTILQLIILQTIILYETAVSAAASEVRERMARVVAEAGVT
jgi:hypothetical protein